jgi:alcohol dehydrogenase class IV
MRFDPGQAFNFLPAPTDIHFGFGALNRLPDRLKALSSQRPFVVTDQGLRAAGLLDRVEAVLAGAGMPAAVFDEVKPDSGSDLIAEATSRLREEEADSVVGIGGGSSLDTAKAVAAMATNAGSILDYAGLHKIVNRPLPTVAIPTTAGTGSEVTLWSVFTDNTRNVKSASGSVLLYPSVALCDPELTLGLPPALTAATGMDALGHAIECYTNDLPARLGSAGPAGDRTDRPEPPDRGSERTGPRRPVRHDVRKHHGRHSHEPDPPGPGARAGHASGQLESAHPARPGDRNYAAGGDEVQPPGAARALR